MKNRELTFSPFGFVSSVVLSPAAACAAVLLLGACSGSTDVVGVLPVDVESRALEGAGQGEGLGGDGASTTGEGLAASELSIVAGMRVDWEGRALEWPFAVSLRDFFADESGADLFVPPPRLERRVMAVMGKPARPDDVRFVAPKPEVVERLRDVFAVADVDFDGEMVARVMRDWRSDEYRVALGSMPFAFAPPESMAPGAASCGNAPSHHGGPCAEEATDGLEHP
jgi:hypothetical protein